MVSLERLAVGRRGRAFHQGDLEAAAQPRQRAAQVVGDVVADLLHADQQALDLVQHGVEVTGQPVELVAPARDRNAAREVAGDDLLAGPVDGVDLTQQAAAQQEAGEQGQLGRAHV